MRKFQKRNQKIRPKMETNKEESDEEEEYIPKPKPKPKNIIQLLRF